MRLAQRGGAEPGARGGAGRKVLHEHVGARDHALQQHCVLGVLDVERDRLLAAVEPDEIGAVAVHHMIVAAREIAFAALDLDHPRAGIGEARGAERRRDRLLERDDQQPFQRTIAQ